MMLFLSHENVRIIINDTFFQTEQTEKKKDSSFVIFCNCEIFFVKHVVNSFEGVSAAFFNLKLENDMSKICFPKIFASMLICDMSNIDDIMYDQKYWMKSTSNILKIHSERKNSRNMNFP